MSNALVIDTLAGDDSIPCEAAPRSVRQHHLARVKHNRQFYWGAGREGKPLTGKALGKVANTTKVVAGARYSKPRKHTPTIQEIRQQQRALHEFSLAAHEAA